MKEIADKNSIKNIIDRRVQNIFPPKERVIEMMAGVNSLKFYYGIDPTGPDLHIGHTVQLLLLKQLHSIGQKIIVLIGDFTARIGDPTGKDSTRIPLTEEKIKENEKGYLNQISKIIPRDYFEVKHNADWLSKMSFGEILRLASHATVQQMLARDMFQERIKKEKRIGVNEFLYPLMQGYDSVAMEVDGEVGGNDQMFNMLVGRDLVREYLKKEKIVLATKLLVNTATGNKISKTEGGFIAINDEPQEIRRKVLDLDDGMIKTIFELCTEKDQEWINNRIENKEPRQLKEELADELIRMYQGDQAVKEAHKPKEISIKDIEIKNITSIIVAANSAPSLSAGKQLINQGAVTLNSKIVKDWNEEVKPGDIIKVGKGRFIKIIT